MIIATGDLGDERCRWRGPARTAGAWRRRYNARSLLSFHALGAEALAKAAQKILRITLLMW